MPLEAAGSLLACKLTEDVFVVVAVVAACLSCLACKLL